MKKTDFRHRARIPFGYRIENGMALIDGKEEEVLRLYFQRYLEGLSMAEAAEEAGLSCSSTTLPLFFRRREYLGTEFYPALITEEYQKRLLAEYEARRRKRERAEVRRPKKAVRIYTRFSLSEDKGCVSEDPAEAAKAFYERIRPIGLE